MVEPRERGLKPVQYDPLFDAIKNRKCTTGNGPLEMHPKRNIFRAEIDSCDPKEFLIELKSALV